MLRMWIFTEEFKKKEKERKDCQGVDCDVDGVREVERDEWRVRTIDKLKTNNVMVDCDNWGVTVNFDTEEF